jgi:hypothetical protein
MHSLQEANEESKAVTKASAMKGIVTIQFCHFLVENTLNWIIIRKTFLVLVLVLVLSGSYSQNHDNVLLATLTRRINIRFNICFV